MRRTFEELLAEVGAPTLAGVKAASLFRWEKQEEDPYRQAERWDRRLAPKGVSVTVLKECPRTGAVLGYVYRRDWLREILGSAPVRAFLAAQGYTGLEDWRGLLDQLAQRLCCEGAFPHEIGVFLGYPLADVEGFIRNQGRNYLFSGYWKVYQDPEEAQARFQCYRRWEEECFRRYQAGESILRLTQAS